MCGRLLLVQTANLYLTSIKQSVNWVLRLYTFIFFIVLLSENRKVLNNVEYFDFNEKRWRVIAPMIIPRKYAGSAILDGQLYAVGGINREYSDLVTVESYNPCVGQWTSVTSLNKCKGNYPISDCWLCRWVNTW